MSAEDWLETTNSGRSAAFLIRNFGEQDWRVFHVTRRVHNHAAPIPNEVEFLVPTARITLSSSANASDNDEDNDSENDPH
jgi:hypothetical protein